MAENIKKVLKNYSDKTEPVVAVFLQSIHWKHVQFLMKDPTFPEIWKYYFHRFPKLTEKTLEELFSKKGKLLAEVWKSRKQN